MSIELKSVSCDGKLKTTTALYELKAWGGSKFSTCLTLDLKVKHAFGKISAEFTDLAPELETDDPEVALDKLATWLERAAAELRRRGPPKPMISAYPNPADPEPAVDEGD